MKKKYSYAKWLEKKNRNPKKYQTPKVKTLKKKHIYSTDYTSKKKYKKFKFGKGKKS